MFKKILIANRGEIACRVAATAHRLGVRTVAVYSDADAQALHVQLCDEAVRIGPPRPAESYLSVERIIAAAHATGAEAIHPGYGFLSENADFAQACQDARLVFIGPPAAAIRAMGLKAEAKRRMGLAGVPLVPGYHGPDQTLPGLQAEADAIGYPVLIKASAGGGGKGMRTVEAAGEFAAALASCQRESLHSFGNGDVLIERYVTRPRHIEVQVFGDSQGHLVHLFERDCSVQRRHQKVLEEAPAPGIAPALRHEMGAAAVAAARAVGYVGAGTVEFIAEPTPKGLRFYFMEMNTRLQVEHPVTEAIAGVDLVEWQLRVACGEPLPRAQHELSIHGHAIEARLCAENPRQQFLPAVGRLDVFRQPCGWRHFQPLPPPSSASSLVDAVRLDAGVRETDTVTPHYDPMLAKLIVWGADRAQALVRLEAALAQIHIAGLHTNVDFLRRVVASPSFAQADLDTAVIERESAALFDAAPWPREQLAAALFAQVLADDRARETADPWSRTDGWRLHGVSTRRLEWTAAGTHGEAQLECAPGGATTLRVDGRQWPFAVSATGGLGSVYSHRVMLGADSFLCTVHATPKGAAVFAAAGSVEIEWVTACSPSTQDSDPANRLTAPMPGKLLAFLVAAGDAVLAGQPLAVLEAMKMEHTIAAPRAGEVQALLFAVGDQLQEGDELLRLAGEGDDTAADASADAFRRSAP